MASTSSFFSVLDLHDRVRCFKQCQPEKAAELPTRLLKVAAEDDESQSYLAANTGYLWLIFR